MPAAAPEGGAPVAGTGGSLSQNREPKLCVFDYDLTLSSHACPTTEGQTAYHCRDNVCDTYGWYPQCLGVNAREAIARCVEEKAYIGIASHADVDYCWDDKIITILTELQFPELTQSEDYNTTDSLLHYPRLDDRNQWNCETCAYQMMGGLPKPDGISRVMRYYGLDPTDPVDRARVIFWDDMPANIALVGSEMPEVRAVLVPNFGESGTEGGCGITTTEIEAGWAP